MAIFLLTTLKDGENRVVSDLLPVGQVQCQRFGMKAMGDEFKDIATPQEWRDPSPRKG